MLKDTLKELEAADEKLTKAIKLKADAIIIHHKSASLRDESKLTLRKAKNEKIKADELLSEYQSLVSKKENGFKNREVMLKSKTKNYEHRLIKENGVLDERTKNLEKRSMALNKRELMSKNHEAESRKQFEKYTSILDFINKTL